MEVFQRKLILLEIIFKLIFLEEIPIGQLLLIGFIKLKNVCI
jgi:hypothetical protein